MVDKVHTYGERDLALKINELIDALDAMEGGAVAWGDITGVPVALTAAQAAGTPSIRAIGATATTAAAGNHTHTGLMTGSATAFNNSATFADLAAATSAFNSLLAALRTRGIITGA